ncbi:MAG: hypothetical protein GX864_04295 [Mollicutes bacterium]|jgi:hypothetical protein|nr:hypothetical protein [Mollicutes bacterium]
MIELLAKNYNWFLIIALVLLFALIGYVIEKKGKRGKSPKSDPLEKEIEDFESIADPTMTLGDAMNKKEEIIIIEDKSPVADIVNEDIKDNNEAIEKKEEVKEKTPKPQEKSDSDIDYGSDDGKMIIDEPDL